MNLLSPINSLGYGIVGLNILKAGVHNGDFTPLWPLGPIVCQSDSDVELVKKCMRDTEDYDVNDACLRIYHQFDMFHFVGKGPRMGFIFFETSQLLPVEVKQLSRLDFVVVSSQWAKNVVCQYPEISQERVVVARPGVDRSIFSRLVKPAKLFGDSTVFLNCGKWEYRKGHDFVIQAFNQAFTPQDNVVLVMNCYNPILPPSGSAEWRNFYMNTPMGKAGKVHVLEHRMETQDELAALMQRADCGFFPARAEGWGLESAEMLAMGKHVIMTDCSAHAEYATLADARVIHVPESQTEIAYDGVFFDGKRGDWAKLTPDSTEQAITHLRSIHKLKQSGMLAFNQKGYQLFEESLTWQNCYLSMKSQI